MTYAGAFMDRHIVSRADYSDYSFFYDSLYGSTVYDASGATIDPSQGIWGKDNFTKQSHEPARRLADRRAAAVRGRAVLPAPDPTSSSSAM